MPKSALREAHGSRAAVAQRAWAACVHLEVAVPVGRMLLGDVAVDDMVPMQVAHAVEQLHDEARRGASRE